MRVICFHNLNELAPYADDWERLAAGVPFRSWTWLSHWWRHYGPRTTLAGSEASLAVLCVFDDADALVGIAPWYLDCSARHGRVLRSAGVRAKSVPTTLSLLCDTAAKEEVVEVLAEYLVDNARDDGPEALHWDLLELDGVDAEDCTMADFVSRLTASGCTVHRRAGRELLATGVAHRLGKLRRLARARHHRRDRATAGAGSPGHESGRGASVTRLDELPQAMDILVELHQRRRQMLGEKGCFASARFLGFYRDVVPELLRRGQVQFYWLELDGKPAAAEYQLAGNGVLYIYQGGRRSRGAGSISRATDQPDDAAAGDRSGAIGHSISCAATSPTRPASAPSRGRRSSSRVVPRRPVARLRHNLWLAGSNVKDWIKRGMRDEGQGAKRGLSQFLWQDATKMGLSPSAPRRMQREVQANSRNPSSQRETNDSNP